MDTAKEYLSQEKYDELGAELQELKTVARKEVAEHLEYAKSLGDLSENAEYHEARDKQADIEDRIKQIETILKNALIIKTHKTGAVTVGSVVSVTRAGQKEETFSIVGSEEADRAMGKISHQSPLGAALLGKKKGDKVIISTPKGELTYQLTDVK